MSILEFNPYGSREGICPHCTRQTGNVARHIRACAAQKQALSTEDERWVGRASAHVVDEAALEPLQRLRAPATELTMARLLLALDRGTEVVQGRRYGWTAPTGSPLTRPMLASCVNEGIRVGLVHVISRRQGPVFYVRVLPASVHLEHHGRPWCEPAPLVGGLKRFRLVKNVEWADCPSCLGLAN